ncbi:unnamed protein product [Aspergillus oryzae var. brunneus]|uniref:Unnamed protein product n=2 Tax=Aspergillus oryzae TaxID=5062 RepID=A0AAN5BZC7_ASPOZ|nr:unnamed protein product [Aspergillus oryzae]GMG32684.1 unnamed protein product [Aspergillus oryzae]GMG49967.1 unnamed protein product [Aspergillus oryzae var. brunneus]
MLSRLKLPGQSSFKGAPYVVESIGGGRNASCCMCKTSNPNRTAPFAAIRAHGSPVGVRCVFGEGVLAEKVVLVEDGAVTRRHHHIFDVGELILKGPVTPSPASMHRNGSA